MKTQRTTSTHTLRILWWLITIIFIAVALFLSNQIGTGSAKLSDKTARSLFGPLLEHFPDLTEEDYEDFHFFLRKSGHVLIHALLAFCLLKALWYTFGKKMPAVLLAVVVACGIAFFDELVQIRAPGRVWAVRDIGFNEIGAIIGICLSGITL